MTRILYVILILAVNTACAQELRAVRGKLLYVDQTISVDSAIALSNEISTSQASQAFKICKSIRYFSAVPVAAGAVLFREGVTELNSIYPPGATLPIVSGAATTLMSPFLFEIVRRRQIQRAVLLFNEGIEQKNKGDLENRAVRFWMDWFIKQKMARMARDAAKAERRAVQAERKRIGIENDRALREAERAAEKNKLERFYAQLTERLSQPLEVIEGVYKSIDQGESYEYDLAILKSLKETDEYIAIVLGSTDPSLNIGMGLFTFKTTAQSNLFFVEYQTKAGKQYTNKTAILDGALLTMGLKSFVKMYPSDGEERNYTEINPLFDWESSGSGVLINQDGYIVTNNHVATGADRIRIAFQNDSTDYNAIIISQNEATDVAILKIEDDRFESNIEPVNWETDFNLGQKVFTLGYPISNKMSNNVKVVDGIVSGENGVGGSPIYFQTTLPVWYGNSGGPCFNSKGEILGLATQILWDQGAKVDNVAYITKTENILNLAGDIINHNSKASQDKDLEQLIEELIPYSVFIKVNY